MFRAVIWKELREQGLIAATLIVLGTGILVAAAALADPPSPSANPADVVRYLGVGRLGTLLLAVTAGMVCGGALFAAERESGTMGFLDSLPSSRWNLWWAKFAAGLALAAVQIALVLIAASALGQVGTVGFGVAVIVYALLAFAWGTYGSTLARTTLGSVGVAIPSATLAAIAYLLPIAIIFAQPGVGWPRIEGAVLFLALMLLTPLVLSLYSFTRPDRERAGDDLAARGWLQIANGSAVGPVFRPAPSLPNPRGRARFGFRALVWLACRQLSLPLLVSSGFAVAAGLTLLLPTVVPILAWPILGLTAGVLAGVTTFSDEQGRGIARFWGERRLPIGRLWWTKVFVHAAFALWLTTLLLLPSVLQAVFNPQSLGARSHSLLSGVFRSLLFEELGRQGWKYLFVPVAYGFAAGHMCGLLFRKAVVAAGVAGLVGGSLAALWLPSLLAGGVWHWQVWLPPAGMLGAAYLQVRPWAADRSFARAPVVTLACGIAVVLLTEAAGLGYRAVEVEDEPTGERDLAFVAAFPEFDANHGGRDFRSAAERYVRVAAKVAAENERPQGSQPNMRPEDHLESILQNGWRSPKNQEASTAVTRWLDALYADHSTATDDHSWFEWAEIAAARPVGFYEDPRLYSESAGHQPLENARRMAMAILARGLLLQVRNGDHAAFVGSYRTVMMLVWNLRNRSIIGAAQLGYIVERSALFAVYQWMKHLPPIDGFRRLESAWLLALAFAANLESDPHAPFDPTPHLLAQRYIVRGLMSAPNQWLPDSISPAGKSRDAAHVEADLVSFAWTVPWERERTRRLVGRVLASGNHIVPNPLVRGRPGTQLLVAWGTSASDLTELDRVVRTLRRGVSILLATRRYQVNDPSGRAPATIDDLVRTGCMPYVPPDPYDGKPFRYRVSAGEHLTQVNRMGAGPAPNPPPSIMLVAGSPVIWSVGPDRIDQGGRQVPIMPAEYPRQEDWVFVLPQ